MISDSEELPRGDFPCMILHGIVQNTENNMFTHKYKQIFADCRSILATPMPINFSDGEIYEHQHGLLII